MSIHSHITDKRSGKAAEVILNHKTDKKALMVATFPYRTFENLIEFFTNDDYGSNMNINPGAEGTPEKIHDGTDSVLWTASDIVGGDKTTFDSTDQNHTPGGAKSIKVDNTEVNDIYQIAKGSAIDLNDYVAFTLWIYVDKEWKVGDSIEIYGYSVDLNVQIGNSVNLQDYFEYSNFDIWQKIKIPLTDMNLTTATAVDSIRVRQLSKDGKAPKYYLDDIQIEEDGIPITYELKAQKGTWLHVDEFTISLADEYAGTLLNGTMPNIPYDSFLGETLITGINYKRVIDGETKFSQTILNVLGFLQLAGTEVSGSGSDGTNTWIVLRVKHIEPLVLKSENDDILSFTISEDLSGLLQLRISAGCRVEQKNDL